MLYINLLIYNPLKALGHTTTLFLRFQFVKIMLFFCITIVMLLFSNLFYFSINRHKWCFLSDRNEQKPFARMAFRIGYSLLLLYILVLRVASVKSIYDVLGDVHRIVDIEDVVTDATENNVVSVFFVVVANVGID